VPNLAGPLCPIQSYARCLPTCRAGRRADSWRDVSEELKQGWCQLPRARFSASSRWCAAYRCIYSNVETACAALARNGPSRTNTVKLREGFSRGRGSVHGGNQDLPAGNCGMFAVCRLALGMARYLHYSCTTPSQGPLSHAHPRQVWKAPRMTGPDSVVAPAPGTTGLRATVYLVDGISLSLPPPDSRPPTMSGRLIPR
jgi:hypothetical protein